MTSVAPRRRTTGTRCCAARLSGPTNQPITQKEIVNYMSVQNEPQVVGDDAGGAQAAQDRHQIARCLLVQHRQRAPSPMI